MFRIGIAIAVGLTTVGALVPVIQRKPTEPVERNMISLHLDTERGTLVSGSNVLEEET